MYRRRCCSRRRDGCGGGGVALEEEIDNEGDVYLQQRRGMMGEGDAQEEERNFGERLLKMRGVMMRVRGCSVSGEEFKGTVA